MGVEQPSPPPTPDLASQTLRDEANKAVKEGELERALALLERAHRLDPDNSRTYLELARLHRRLGDEAMARATAARGLLYCDEARLCDKLRDYAGDS